MHIDDLTIYTSDATPRQTREAKSISSLAIGLTKEFLTLQDIRFAPSDPPDFELVLTDGRLIGMELTDLIRRPSLAKKGDKELHVQFSEWERGIQTSAESIEAEYEWTGQSLPQMFDAAVSQLHVKERKVAGIVGKYSELWLCFRITKGNPVALTVRFQRDPTLVQKRFAHFFGRFFRDMSVAAKDQSAFAQVLFVSDDSWFALPVVGSSHTIRLLPDAWFRCGGECPEEEYRTFTVSSRTEIKRQVGAKQPTK